MGPELVPMLSWGFEWSLESWKIKSHEHYALQPMTNSLILQFVSEHATAKALKQDRLSYSLRIWCYIPAYRPKLMIISDTLQYTLR